MSSIRDLGFGLLLVLSFSAARPVHAQQTGNGFLFRAPPGEVSFRGGFDRVAVLAAHVGGAYPSPCSARLVVEDGCIKPVRDWAACFDERAEYFAALDVPGANSSSCALGMSEPAMRAIPLNRSFDAIAQPDLRRVP